MSRDPIDDELGQMSANPRMAHVVKDVLRQMRDGSAGPVFAELARDLLEGRVRLRDLGRSNAYGAEFAVAFERYERWKAEQPPADWPRTIEETRIALRLDEPEDP